MPYTMALNCWELIAFLYVSVQSVHGHSGAFVESRTTARLAFAGGGFGNTSSSAKKSTKPDNKRKRTGFAKIEHPIHKAEKEDEPKLDKWGLPIPTEDELFPPMPPGTELIPAPPRAAPLEDIKAALKDHITLAFNNFDEDGVEQSPSLGNPPMKLKLLHKSPPGT